MTDGCHNHIQHRHSAQIWQMNAMQQVKNDELAMDFS
jgi:hypothetical protein